MARVIIQQNFFDWKQLEAASDLERLEMVLEAIPDEELMRKLEAARKGRRDDNPVRAMWNSLLAAIVYGHDSIASLRRELLRNPAMLELCGFDVLKGKAAVPSEHAYKRFLKKLLKYQSDIDAIFDELVETLRELLPDFGRHLTVDSKAVSTHARGRKEPATSADPDADWGLKRKTEVDAEGRPFERLKKWFGYKLHLLVDADSELPVAYEVTRASASDMTMLKPMLEDMHERHPDVVQRAEYLSADKGYDSQDNNRFLWDEYEIKPLIGIRQMWKEAEGEVGGEGSPRQLYPERADNILYDEEGSVYCVCMETGEIRPMAYGGFERSRESLKYRCPRAAYGLQCESVSQCGTGNYGPYGRIVRIPLETDRRIFVPCARSSYAFEREYRKRTSVERVNSRIQCSFGFERHFVRRLAKMKLKAGIALVVMLAMAVGRIQRNQKDKMRSLAQAA